MRVTRKPEYVTEERILIKNDYDSYDPAKDIHGVNIDTYIEKARADFRHDWWNYLDYFYN